MRPITPKERARIADHLRGALDQVVAAAVIVGALPEDEVPDDALDAALQGDEAFQAARVNLRRAFDRLRAAAPDLGAKLGLDLEAAANHLSAQAAVVGVRLGRAMRAGAR
jgi:hypothetical protein